MHRIFVLAVLFFVSSSFSVMAATPVPSAVPGKYSSLIEKISLQYGLNPRFVQAVVWRESNFKSNAHGAHGEIGLMQLKMSTVRDWAKAHKRGVPSQASLYDAEVNLHIGIWRLDKALKNWEGYPDQVSLALFEYNAGRTAILRRLAHCNGDVSQLLQTYQSGDYAFQILEKYGEYSRVGEPELDIAQF